MYPKYKKLNEIFSICLSGKLIWSQDFGIPKTLDKRDLAYLEIKTSQIFGVVRARPKIFANNWTIFEIIKKVKTLNDKKSQETWNWMSFRFEGSRNGFDLSFLR